MNEAILKAFEKLENVSITLLATLCATLGFLVFVPDTIADRLKVLSFRNDYAVFLGPVFLLFAACLLARVISETTDLLRSRKADRERDKQLTRLTPEERGYLSEFIVNGRNTVKVGMDDGIMGGLVAKKICYMSTNMFDLLEGASFNLQPWARSYLETHPDVLDGAVGVPLTPRQKMRRGGL
jgi:Super-infection exclusion protein B